MTIVFKVSDNIKEKMIEYYMDKKKGKNSTLCYISSSGSGYCSYFI